MSLYIELSEREKRQFDATTVAHKTECECKLREKLVTQLTSITTREQTSNERKRHLSFEKKSLVGVVVVVEVVMIRDMPTEQQSFELSEQPRLVGRVSKQASQVVRLNEHTTRRQKREIQCSEIGVVFPFTRFYYTPCALSRFSYFHWFWTSCVVIVRWRNISIFFISIFFYTALQLSPPILDFRLITFLFILFFNFSYASLHSADFLLQ